VTGRCGPRGPVRGDQGGKKMPDSRNDFPRIVVMISAGDPDPWSAGTVGDAARRGGSSVVMGMAANPSGAHQARPRFRWPAMASIPVMSSGVRTGPAARPVGPRSEVGQFQDHYHRLPQCCRAEPRCGQRSTIWPLLSYRSSSGQTISKGLAPLCGRSRSACR
jgi:hypothetical protein